MIRVPAAGAYYLRMKTEANVPTDARSPIRLTMSERAWWGDPVPFRNAALITLLVAAAMVAAPSARTCDD